MYFKDKKILNFPTWLIRNELSKTLMEKARELRILVGAPLDNLIELEENLPDFTKENLIYTINVLEEHIETAKRKQVTGRSNP